jgi:hypothetical protein
VCFGDHSHANGWCSTSTLRLLLADIGISGIPCGSQSVGSGYVVAWVRLGPLSPGRCPCNANVPR